MLGGKPLKQMDKHGVKYTLREILTIVFFWLLAIAAVYIIYLKIRMLQHGI